MTVATSRLVLLVALAALAVGAWRVTARPAAEAQKVVADGAVSAIGRIDDARFTVAEANLALQLQTTGSYAGAAMPPGAVLVRADAAGFCVQLTDGGPVSHLAGPGATPAPGPCS